MSDTGWHIDIRESDESAAASDGASSADAASASRPWVGIQFECCGVYARVYRNPEATAYEGRCPHCLRVVTLRVGPGGTNSRFFTAH